MNISDYFKTCKYWLSSPGERERHTVMSGGAGEVNMLQSLFSLQLPLTHNPFI